MMNDILEKLNEVFRDILDNEKIDLELGYTANDIDEWNSLTHIQLIVEIENAFSIKFTSTEITRIQNIENLVETISAKL